MTNQAIRDSILCATVMAAEHSRTAIEGFLPLISTSAVNFCLRSPASHTGDPSPPAQAATAVPCHRITWREFQATDADFARLSMAWDAAARALVNDECPQSGDPLPESVGRALDLTTRAICALETSDGGGAMLLIDSGPLAFRWALLPVAAEHFDTVVLSAIDGTMDVSPECPPSDDAEGTPVVEALSPDSMLAVVRNIDAARINRHLSGVPSVTLESVLALARVRERSSPILTVVIPVLDHEALNHTLQSIAMQETDCDVEVLIMRASRRGATAQAVDEHAGAGLRVFDITIADGSPYEAMNAGLTLAASPWIYFMGCGDSFSHAQVLSALHSEFLAAPESCGMIYGNVRMDGVGPGAKDGEIYAGAFSYERLREQNICHQAIVYRVDRLRRLGGFDSRYTINADWAANLKGWQVLQPIYIDLVVANFVRGGLSTTGWDGPFFEDLDEIWTENRPSPGA
jgi:hypothetical protein